MPQSAIAESCRQISFQVATAVLEQRSSAVPLHTKRTCGVCRGNKGVYRRKRSMARVEKTGEPADGETIRGRRKEPAVAKGQDARLHGQGKTCSYKHIHESGHCICIWVLSAAGNGTFRCDGDGSETSIVAAAKCGAHHSAQNYETNRRFRLTLSRKSDKFILF